MDELVIPPQTPHLTEPTPAAVANPTPDPYSDLEHEVLQKKHKGAFGLVINELFQITSAPPALARIVGSYVVYVDGEHYADRAALLAHFRACKKGAKLRVALSREPPTHAQLAEAALKAREDERVAENHSRRADRRAGQGSATYGRVRSVQVQLKILNVWGVETVQETFSTELRISSRWRVTDQEHVKDAITNGVDHLDVDWEPEWVPRFSLWGCIAREDGVKEYFAQTRGGQVWIEGVQWMTVQLSEQYDLRSFPFDVQDLNLRLSVDNCTSLLPLDGPSPWQRFEGTQMVRHVPLSLANFRLRFALFRSHAIGAGKPVRMVRRTKSRGNVREPHRLDVVLLCKRRQRFYVYNYFALLVCIGTASLASFAVHWREISSRLGLDITLLLVAFAFKQELASNTPDIAYLTVLDLFAIVVIGFLFLCVLLHAAIGFLMYDCDTLTGECTMGEYSVWDNSVRETHWKVSADPGPNPQRSEQDRNMAMGYLFDAWCKYIYTTLWLAWNVYFWVGRVRQIERDNEARLQRTTVLGAQGGWQEADELPKPSTWDDEQPSSSSDSEQEEQEEEEEEEAGVAATTSGYNL